jgi:Mrp family chromosome partitioning ATPase
MARILDVGHRSDHSRQRIEAVVAPKQERALTDDVDDREDSSIPFIEVGGKPAKTSPAKESPRASRQTPSILPLNRIEAKKPDIANPSTLFRVSFRPLPYVTPPQHPVAQRFPQELVSWHQPEHEISGQYRAVLHEIEQQLGVSPGKVVLMTAAAAGAGTTSVLLNLALTCARRDHERVAIVDANFSAPALAQRLGVSATPGLREVLCRSLPLAWAVQETGVPNLSALTIGEKGPAPSLELWSNIIDHLRKRFDWVLVDSAAWLEGTHLSALAGPCSASYLVLRPGDFEAPHLDDMLTSVAHGGGSVRGYVLAQA